MSVVIQPNLPTDFPKFPIFGVILKGISMCRAPIWDRRTFMSEYYERVRKKHLTIPIGEHPFLKVYRQFYWKIIKLDPAKHRPASEALIRRFIRRKDLPRINPVVDIFNTVSDATGMAMHAYDYDNIRGSLTLALSSGNERFTRNWDD